MTWVDYLRSANFPDLKASGCRFFSETITYWAVFAAGFMLSCSEPAGRNVSRTRQRRSWRAAPECCGGILGKTGFLVTLLSDFGKGALAVWIAHHLLPKDELASIAALAMVLVDRWTTSWPEAAARISTAAWRIPSAPWRSAAVEHWCFDPKLAMHLRQRVVPERLRVAAAHGVAGAVRVDLRSAGCAVFRPGPHPGCADDHRGRGWSFSRIAKSIADEFSTPH